MSTLFRFLVLCLALASVTEAQTVRVVDDDGGVGVDFLEIRDAVAAANDGDLVLVRAGTYLDFIIDGKSLTVAADVGARPIVTMYLPYNPRIEIKDLQPGQEVYLRGLRFVGSFVHFSIPFPEPSIRVRDCGGEVWIEDCLFASPALTMPTAIDIANGAAVNITRCDVTCTASSGTAFSGEFGFAIDALASNVTIYDSYLEGGPGSGAGFLTSTGGGHGVKVDQGSLFVAGSTLVGGDGVSIPIAGVATNGGNALDVHGGATVHIRDTVLQAGASADPGGGAPSSNPGVEIALVSGSVTNVTSDGRSLVIDSPVRLGEEIVQTFTGTPGDLVYVMFSTGQSPGAYVPAWHGALVIDFSAVSGHVVGTIGPSGVLEGRSQVVSPLASGFQLVTAQASFVNGVLGGNLSSPSTLLLLIDPAPFRGALPRTLARTIHEHARQTPQPAGFAGLSSAAGTLRTPASSTT